MSALHNISESLRRWPMAVSPAVQAKCKKYSSTQLAQAQQFIQQAIASDEGQTGFKIIQAYHRDEETGVMKLIFGL